MRTIEDQSFLILLIAVSVAFGWILQPYFGSIVWGIVAAIVFAPFCNWLSGFLRWPSLAPLITVIVTIAIVIVPLIVVAAALGREATNLYRRIQSGEIDFVGNTQQILDALPGWARDVLGWFGLTDLDTMRAALTTPLVKSSQYLATQALSFGSLTFDFIIGLCVMLYLLFFLLQDGDVLARRVKAAIPLQDGRKKALVTRFIAVIRATVKGNEKAQAALTEEIGRLATTLGGAPVSTETTGSVAKPSGALDGWVLWRVRNGKALVKVTPASRQKDVVVVGH